MSRHAYTPLLAGSNRSSDPPLTVEVVNEFVRDLSVCTSGTMVGDVGGVEGAESNVSIQTAVCSGSLATGLLVVCSLVT